MKAKLEHLKVLLVDDNLNTRRLVETMLKSFGIENILHTKDWEEGLRQFREAELDIVITDLNMAPMDGLTFTRRLRRGEDSTKRRVPIIAMTAQADKDSVVSARDASVTEFLAKPLSPRALHDRMMSAISRQREFLETKAYVGPDRRRRREPEAVPEERRGKRRESDAPVDTAAE